MAGHEHGESSGRAVRRAGRRLERASHVGPRPATCRRGRGRGFRAGQHRLPERADPHPVAVPREASRGRARGSASPSSPPGRSTTPCRPRTASEARGRTDHAHPRDHRVAGPHRPGRPGRAAGRSCRRRARSSPSARRRPTRWPPATSRSRRTSRASGPTTSNINLLQPTAFDPGGARDAALQRQRARRRSWSGSSYAVLGGRRARGLRRAQRHLAPAPEPVHGRRLSSSGPDHTPEDMCASVGGEKGMRRRAMQMAHLWQVPGWESPWGLFSGENPSLNMVTTDVGH